MSLFSLTALTFKQEFFFQWINDSLNRMNQYLEKREKIEIDNLKVTKLRKEEKWGDFF